MNISLQNIFQCMRYLVTPEDSEASSYINSYKERDVPGIFKGMFWAAASVAAALIIAGLN